jgi:hypothetical protein
LTLPVILFLKLGKQIPPKDQLPQDTAWRKAGQTVGARSGVQGASPDSSMHRHCDRQCHSGQTALCSWGSQDRIVGFSFKSHP